MHDELKPQETLKIKKPFDASFNQNDSQTDRNQDDEEHTSKKGLMFGSKPP